MKWHFIRKRHNFPQHFSVSQASSGSTRQHTDSLTVTHSLTPRTVTGVISHGEGERRKAESPDRWSERLATIFPVVRLVQVQVSCVSSIFSFPCIVGENAHLSLLFRFGFTWSSFFNLSLAFSLIRKPCLPIGSLRSHHTNDKWVHKCLCDAWIL